MACLKLQVSLLHLVRVVRVGHDLPGSHCVERLDDFLAVRALELLLVFDQHFLTVLRFFKDVSFVVFPAAEHECDALIRYLCHRLYAVEVYV